MITSSCQLKPENNDYCRSNFVPAHLPNHVLSLITDCHLSFLLALKSLKPMIRSQGFLGREDEVRTQLPNQLFLGWAGGLSGPSKDIYYIHTGVFKFVIRFLLRINVVTIMCKYLSVAVPPSGVSLLPLLFVATRLAPQESDLSYQKYHLRTSLLKISQ